MSVPICRQDSSDEVFQSNAQIKAGMLQIKSDFKRVSFYS